MKLLFAIPILFSSLPVSATDIQYRKTYCNGYYNSSVKRWDTIPCDAWFSNKKLVGLKFRLSPNTKTYEWLVGQPKVQPDKRWSECIRFTSSEGNQWQFCTVSNVQQLNIN